MRSRSITTKMLLSLGATLLFIAALMNDSEWPLKWVLITSGLGVLQFLGAAIIDFIHQKED